MFVTIVFVVCTIALVVNAFVIYKLIKLLDSNERRFTDILRQRSQVINDLETAVELLHKELLKTGTDGGKNN
jgi:hypothetical protein